MALYDLPQLPAILLQKVVSFFRILTPPSPQQSLVLIHSHFWSSNNQLNYY